MSWAFLHHRHGLTMLLDNEEYNDNIAVWASEVDGNLNEHNYAERILEAVVAGGFAAMSLGLRAYNNKQARDPQDYAATGLEVPQSERWNRVEDTDDLFVSRGGKVMVIMSFQCHMDPLSTDATGLNFAIELDGQVMASSLLGTGDESNDFVDGGIGYSLEDVLAPPVFQLNYGTSPSFRAVQTPHRVVGVFHVEPGEHQIWLVARNLRTVESCNQWITNCEAIILDGWS